MSEKLAAWPTPWTVETPQSNDWNNITDAHGASLAEAIPSAAMASLFAAAPDMLATLKAMTEAYADQPICAWFGAIHAAIAKAEGKKER